MKVREAWQLSQFVEFKRTGILDQAGRNVGATKNLAGEASCSQGKALGQGREVSSEFAGFLG